MGERAWGVEGHGPNLLCLACPGRTRRPTRHVPQAPGRPWPLPCTAGHPGALTLVQLVLWGRGQRAAGGRGRERGGESESPCSQCWPSTTLPPPASSRIPHLQRGAAPCGEPAPSPPPARRLGATLQCHASPHPPSPAAARLRKLRPWGRRSDPGGGRPAECCASPSLALRAWGRWGGAGQRHPRAAGSLVAPWQRHLVR